MNRVSHVAGEKKAALNRLIEINFESLGNSLQQTPGVIRVSSHVSLGTYFLVVKSEADSNRVLLSFVQSRDRLQRSEEGENIVDSLGRNELAVDSNEAGILGVRETKVEAFDALCFYFQLLGNRLHQQGAISLGLHQLSVQLCSENRFEILLLVNVQWIRVLQMNTHGGDLCNGLRTPVQNALQLSLLLHNNSSSKNQVPVDPSVPQPASVQLHVALHESDLVNFVLRSHSDAGRVRVSRHDSEPLDEFLPLGNSESDERREEPTRQKVLPSRENLEALADFLKPAFLQQLDSLLDHVIRTWAVRVELEELLCEFLSFGLYSLRQY